MADTLQARRLAEQLQGHWQSICKLLSRCQAYIDEDDWDAIKEEMAELERKLKQVGIDL